MVDYFGEEPGRKGGRFPKVWYALGVPLVPRMTSGRARYLARQKITFAAAAFLLFLFAYFITKLR